VWEEVDQVCRNFLWGDYENVKHVNDAKHVPDAFMANVAWELCSEPSKLWVQVSRSKYGCGDSMMPVIGEKRCGSNIWSGIKTTIWGTVQKIIFCRVGNGNTMKV